MSTNLTLFRIPSGVALQTKEAVRAGLESARATGATIELAEAWPGLHWVMSGEIPIPKYEAQRRGIQWFDGSLENVLLGGEPLPLKTGFGPARWLAPTEVADLARLLDDLTPDEVASRYDADGLAEDGIPPAGWDESHRAWLKEAYAKLRDFFSQAAQVHDGIGVVID